MKGKYSRTLWGVIILCLFFITACGGGGGGDASYTVIAEPKLTLSETTADPNIFEGVVVKNSAERTFTITSSGTRTLNINGISSSNSSVFSVPDVSNTCLPYPKALAVNRTCTFSVRFAPDNQGTQSANILITGDVPRTTTLNGFGYGINVWINRIISAACGVGGVVFDVTVTNPKGELVDPLEPDEFTLTHGGSVVSQENITAFQYTDPDPVSVVLALDLSSSQTNNLDTIKAAAQSFINQLRNNEDWAAICMFRRQNAFYPATSLLLMSNDNKDALTTFIEGFDETTLTDGTSLRDSVYDSIERAKEGGATKKAVIVLSDGVDTASTSYTVDQVIEHAKANGVLVFTIFYVDPVYYPTATPATMQQLAIGTGGQYYNSGNSSDLTNIFEQISKVLSNKYRITYTPPTCTGASLLKVDAQTEGLTGSDNRAVNF